MATFQVRIEDIIGATASVGSDDGTANEQAIQDALQDTASDILSKIRPDLLLPFAVASSSATSNPILSNVETVRILSVERNSENDLIGDFIYCVFIDSSLTNKVQVPESVYFATEQAPRWTFHNKNLYVYPAPDSNNAARYLSVAIPTIEHGDSSVTAFPDELEHALVLGASAMLKQRQITYFNEDEDGELVALHRAQWAELEQKYKDVLAPYLARGE